TYGSTKTALTADDIAAIRAIYSAGLPRSSDRFDAVVPNNTALTATDLTSLIDPGNRRAIVTALDITTTSDIDYYTFTAPDGSNGSLTVTAQSKGLSLLSPKLIVYGADGTTVLGSASGLNQYGTTLTVTVNNVVAGQSYYVRVSGADTTPFS